MPNCCWIWTEKNIHDLDADSRKCCEKLNQCSQCEQTTKLISVCLVMEQQRTSEEKKDIFRLAEMHLILLSMTCGRNVWSLCLIKANQSFRQWRHICLSLWKTNFCDHKMQPILNNGFAPKSHPYICVWIQQNNILGPLCRSMKLLPQLGRTNKSKSNPLFDFGTISSTIVPAEFLLRDTWRTRWQPVPCRTPRAQWLPPACCCRQYWNKQHNRVKWAVTRIHWMLCHAKCKKTVWTENKQDRT